MLTFLSGLIFGSGLIIVVWALSTPGIQSFNALVGGCVAVFGLMFLFLMKQR